MISDFDDESDDAEAKPIDDPEDDPDVDEIILTNDLVVNSVVDHIPKDLVPKAKPETNLQDVVDDAKQLVDDQPNNDLPIEDADKDEPPLEDFDAGLEVDDDDFEDDADEQIIHDKLLLATIDGGVRRRSCRL